MVLGHTRLIVANRLADTCPCRELPRGCPPLRRDLSRIFPDEPPLTGENLAVHHREEHVRSTRGVDD